MLLLIFIGIIAFTGLSKGFGVLPDGPLNASVGGTVLFGTTLNPTEDPVLSVIWSFVDGVATIITSLSDRNVTAPEYEGRITLFRSNGSLELRDLKLSDSGDYQVNILTAAATNEIGKTRLQIYEQVSSVSITPQSADLVEFNLVHLSCSSSGTSLSFLWMKNSSEVTASDRVQISKNENNSTLTIVNVTRHDQGSYSCYVYNPVSEGSSDPVILVISYGPENIQLNVLPSKDHYEEGSDIRLTCSVESQPHAEYKWFLNEVMLPDTGPELRLNNIQPSQSGNYSCQAFNNKTLRTQTSQSSHVSVLALVSNVKVTAQSSDLVEFNSSVRLSCSSSGSYLSFLWMNSSSEVTASDRVQITDGGSTLTIINVTRYDQGPYSCHVSNPVSNASSDPVNFLINHGPENLQLNISPSKEHEEGSDVTLSCSAESKPTAEYFWFLDGEMLPDQGPELRLMDIQMNQRGNYSCQAYNSKTLRYETSQSSAVSILARISNVVVDSNSTDLVEFNSSVMLSCSSSGFSPSFSWTNGSSEVTDGDRFQLSKDNSTLKIVNVTRSDQGLLRCQASNYFSRNSSDPVNLNINYGPEDIVLTILPKQEYYEEGTDVVLSCSANSKPNATFRWFLNEKPPKLVANSGSQITLININKSHMGNYSCLAFNEKTLRNLKSQILTVSVSGNNSSSPGLSAGAIAAIVVVCLVFIAGLSVGLFIKTLKKPKKISPRRIIATITGGNKKNNTDNTSEELNYADLKFQKKKKGQNEQVELENTSEYAQIRVNNTPAASSPYAQEQNYAELNYANKRNGGAVHLEFNISSPDTHIKVNASGPPTPPPKTYKGQNEQLRGPAPHDANAEQLYSQVHKSQRR